MYQSQMWCKTCQRPVSDSPNVNNHLCAVVTLKLVALPSLFTFVSKRQLLLAHYWEMIAHLASKVLLNIAEKCYSYLHHDHVTKESEIHMMQHSW